MPKSTKTLAILALVSSCALLLSACWGGSSGSKKAVITAHATIPASVTANSTFTVSVSLTSTGKSGGTASVQVVDVGAATPPINCGSAQMLTIGGAGGNFSCQAPAANLGQNNTHQLQVNVNGTANLSAPVAVEVVNGGQVDVKLTNTSGSTITTATPGQTIEAAFSTTTTPAGIGSYTVTAPSGWTVGNSGVCDINAQSASCKVPVTVAASAASGSYAISIAAEKDSSPLSATSLSLSVNPTVITAHTVIPLSVVASSPFTVNVSLTSTGKSGGTASVQVVDVGTVTPKIDCGSAQTLTIGGAGGNFTCQAPAVNLGQSNTHQLQVNVNGTANLPAPVAVGVVNGGRVDVQLTNTSGSPISTAQPSQTVEVAFSTTTTPKAIGKYTVTAPSGWTIGNGAACSFTGSNSSCKVPVTVAAKAASGAYTISIVPENGSSELSATSLPLTVQNQPSSNTMTFDLAQNIAETLYANLPSQATTFTYNPVFLFKNPSTTASLSITAVNASGFNAKASVKYGCNIAAPSLTAAYPLSTSPSCTLKPGQLYAVVGNLDNSFPAPTPATAPVVGTASISISIQGSTKTFVNYDTNVTFVQYKEGYVAVRAVNKNLSEGPELWIAAVYGPNMVQFSGSPPVGTAPNSGTLNFAGDQIQLPQTGGVFYMPYGDSGGIYLTRASAGFSSIPANSAPTPTGSVQAPPFLQIEFTYKKNLGGGKAPCTATPTLCESLTVDQTYVNFINVLGRFNSMGKADANVLVESAGGGFNKSYTKAQIFQGVADFFNKQGAPWAYDPTRHTTGTPEGLQNYVQHATPTSTSSSITEVLAPIQVFAPGAVTAPWPVPYYDPMPNNYYDQYIQDSWTYLKSHPVYIHITSALTGTSNCVLKGAITPATAPGTSGQLVFNQSSGTCPPEADSPNNIAFYDLDKCDFVLAAGGACTHPGALFGVNNTYRSVLGQTIAAYEAIGLFPCAGTSSSAPMSPANAQADVASGNAFKNPSCLTGLGPAPTWNVYAAALRPYVDVYTYAYGDFLGIDRTVTFSVNAFASSPTLYKDMPRVQPVTISLH